MTLSKKKRFIPMTEFNERLAWCAKFCRISFDKTNISKIVFSYDVALLDIGLSTASLTYRSNEGVVTYKVQLDRSECDCNRQIDGGDAFRTISRYYRTPRYKTDRNDKCDFDLDVAINATPLIWMNPKYEKTRQHVYYYDLNSAYATVMANYDFPDTSVEPVSKVVSEGEIGFDNDGLLVHPGQYASYVFPTMESPFKSFVARWYKRKKNAKTPAEKIKAKNMLCYCVGYWQIINPFLRAFVVNSCNEYIQSLVNEETTIYCNTDCIVSLVPLPELKIGEELGEWKFKEGEFAYIGLNYQFNGETPVWRGIPKGWWDKHPNFDILKDEPPHGGNVYEFNFKKFQFDEVKYEI